MSGGKKRRFAARPVKDRDASRRVAISGLATVLLTGSLVVLPASFESGGPTLGGVGAWAKGGPGAGAGNGGGNGGGNGNGGGSAASGQGNGNGNGNGGQGSASASASDGGNASANANGKSASLMGSLNAAHAAPQALANANQNSRVGQIATYSSAIQANDVDTAAAALAEASNKDDGIVESVVHAVNSLLGIDNAEAVSADSTDTGDTGDTADTAEPTAVVTVHSLEADVVSAIQGPAPEPEAPATP